MGNHYNCIYMYTNLINGKKYVGKAKDFNNRHKQHLKGNEQLIDKKIKEYGQQNFKVEILIENVQDDDKLNEYEKFFIKRKRSHISYGTGYNRTWGGDGGYSLDGMTEEQRKEHGRKISEATKGKPRKPCSEETKRKLSEALSGEKSPNYGVHRYGKDSPHYGHKRTEESKQRQSENMKGRYIGDKNPMYGKGYKLSGDKNPRARKVICLDTLDIFATVKEAKKWCGGGAIEAQIKGQRNYAGKHPITGIKLHWMYYEDYLKLQEEQQNKTQDLVTEVA